MTRQDLQARAAARAIAQHVKPYRLSDGTYAVPSSTTDGIAYTVRVNADSEPECTCTGYEYRQSCKHVESVRALIRKAEPTTHTVTAGRVVGLTSDGLFHLIEYPPLVADLTFEQFVGAAS